MENISEIIDNIEIEIVKQETKERDYKEGEYEIILKLLVKNNTQFSFSKVYFEIRFYDENKKVIDVDKATAYDIRPYNESVEIISFYTDDSNVASYDLRIANVRFA